MENYEISLVDCPQALQDEIQHHLNGGCKLLSVNRFVYDDDTFTVKAYLEDCYEIFIMLHCYSNNAGDIIRCFVNLPDLKTFYQHSKLFRKTIKLLGDKS